MSAALVQSKHVATGTGTTTATATGTGYTSTTSAGSFLLLVAYATRDSGLVGTAPTISAPVTSGFTWTLTSSGQFDDNTNKIGGRVAIYYIENAASMSSGLSTSVTANSGSMANVRVEFACYEFSGMTLLGASEVGQTVNNGVTATVGAGTLSTSNTDLIVVAAIGEGSTLTAGSGYTLGVSATGIAGFTQYSINTPAGDLPTAFGGTLESPWGVRAQAFKVAVPATKTQAWLFGF